MEAVPRSARGLPSGPQLARRHRSRHVSDRHRQQRNRRPRRHPAHAQRPPGSQRGHVGYAVLPEHRRRGHGRAILQQSLDLAHRMGIERVFITCDDGNDASRRIIESCGGTLESVEPWSDGTLIRRYWI
ncbi:GNAT family N-acetyltransferase [Nocardia sp. NPDC050408]|uniref:GNAT family N-acetyltransferase n=1 Tax=Nocardia sp. NPDC050408 TaxID=3364319 RepID=UPI0037AA593F